MKQILKDIREYIISNLSIIILIIGFFVLGIVLSVICLNMQSDENKGELVNKIDELNIELKSEDYSLNYMDILINTLKDTGFFTLILVALGSSIVFNRFINFLFMYKGYCLGICVSTNILLMGSLKGTIYSLILFLIPYTIFFVFEIFLSIIWTRFGNDILKDKKFFNVKKKIFVNSIITIISFILMQLIMAFSNIIACIMIINYVRII